jgi:hypothetical protein
MSTIPSEFKDGVQETSSLNHGPKYATFPSYARYNDRELIDALTGQRVLSAEEVRGVMAILNEKKASK